MWNMFSNEKSKIELKILVERIFHKQVTKSWIEEDMYRNSCKVVIAFWVLIFYLGCSTTLSIICVEGMANEKLVYQKCFNELIFSIISLIFLNLELGVVVWKNKNPSLFFFKTSFTVLCTLRFDLGLSSFSSG